MNIRKKNCMCSCSRSGKEIQYYVFLSSSTELYQTLNYLLIFGIFKYFISHKIRQPLR